MINIPNYLKEYQNLYRQNPRKANLQWFRNAKYGLFLHYGLYSMLGRHEWVQYREKIPVSQYAMLKEQFTAEKFDANYIASFAVDCGMKYINITTRHHDSFCLWDTKETDFNSVNSPAKRDLVLELALACERHGLGLFLYYSHGRDWRHPHAPNNDEFQKKARPEYDPPESCYKYGDEHDLNIYLAFAKNQITELLTKYPTVAGIWLDGIGVLLKTDASKFKCQDLYDHIHQLHPHALVSYKQGLIGTEDFFAPEHKIPVMTDETKKSNDISGKIAEHPDKVIEICTTMIQNPVSWGYTSNATHQTPEEVWERYVQAYSLGANLLLNTGLMGDGSVDPIDDKLLREVGERIKKTNLSRE